MPQAKVYRTYEKGLFDKPTIINNVETFANIAQIVEKGSDWFCNFNCGCMHQGAQQHQRRQGFLCL